MRRILPLLVATLTLALLGCGPKVTTVPHSQAPIITPDADIAVVYITAPLASACQCKKLHCS